MYSNTLFNYLCDNQLFCGIAAQEINRLNDVLFEVRIYQKGSVIAMQGSPAEELYLIAKGNVLITKTDQDGKERRIARAGARSILGESSVIKGKRRSASLIAGNDLVLVAIGKENLFYLIDAIPQINQNLISLFEKRLKESDKRAENELERYRQMLELNRKIITQRNQIQAYASSLKKLNGELSQKNEQISVQKSELEILNAQLSQAIATKDRFFSIVAHDLKNPFTVLIGMSEFLRNQLQFLSPKEIEEMADALYSSSSRAYALLENLLQWSRSERGMIKYNPSKVKVSSLLVNVKELLQDFAQQKEISLLIESESHCEIETDVNMLETVFRNLVSNAIKYTHRQGRVCLKALPQNGSILFCVEDNGVGMSREVLEKLFKLEENYSTLGTEEEKGTGLGLILCREFVAKLGGKLVIESHEGKGSKFSFELFCN